MKPAALLLCASLLVPAVANAAGPRRGSSALRPSKASTLRLPVRFGAPQPGTFSVPVTFDPFAPVRMWTQMVTNMMAMPLMFSPLGYGARFSPLGY